MAIVTRRTRHGNSYTAVYRVDGKQRSAGTFADKKLAQAAYMEHMAAVKRGVDPSAKAITVETHATKDGQITVAGWAGRWLPKHELSEHSREGYTSALNARIIPRFGTVALAALTSSDIAEWVREMREEGLAASTRRKYVAVLKSLIQSAVEDKNVPIENNVVKGVRMGKSQRERRKALTHEQYAAAREHIPEHYQLWTDFITDTGLRWEEALAVKIDDIVRGEDGYVIYVGAVLNELRNPQRFVYEGRTKTKVPRQVLIDFELGDRLVQRDKENRAAGRKSGFLFLNERGGHIVRERFRRIIWIPAMKAAGVEGMAPRDMRRTHASWLLDGGAPLEVISNRLGHGSLNTTVLYLDTIRATEKAALGYLKASKARG